MGSEMPNVLIVDANDEDSKNLKNIIQDEGYHIFTAATAREAVRLIRTEAVDLVIINTWLDDIEGYKVIPILKDINPRLKFIVTTDEHSDEIEETVRREEIVYYAIKPDDYDVIKDAVITAAPVEKG